MSDQKKTSAVTEPWPNASPTSNWETLLAELNKRQPDQRKIRLLMTELGLEYSKDPLEQMSRCLLHFDQIRRQTPSVEL